MAESAIVVPLLAAFACIPLLLIPGWLIVSAAAGVQRHPDLLRYLYMSVVVGTLLHGWLALLLAELGIFSLGLQLALITLICFVAGVLAFRRGGLRVPPTQLGLVSNAPIRQAATRFTLGSRADLLELLAFAAVGVLFLLLVVRPFEVVLGARDAGVYANTGFAIARTGAIVQDDPIVRQIGLDQQASDAALAAAAAQAETNFLGVQHPERFIATRQRAAGFMIAAGDLEAGRVTPQFFHLYPSWIALLTSLVGLQGGLFATGLMGFLGVWSVGMLGRLLAGPWVGVVAALLLALNGVQVWFSRYSTAESTVQFLAFAGLYCFAVAALRPSNAAQPDASEARFRLFAALLAGLCFGQWLLARIDFLLILPPLGLFLGYAWLRRRWERRHTLLLLGFGTMSLHAALHVAFVARAYFFDTLFARLQDVALTALASMPFLTETLRVYYLTRPGTVVGIRLGPGEGLFNWPRILLEIVAVLIAVALLLLLRARGQGLLERAELLVRRSATLLLRLSTLGIILLALYAYFVRPGILTPAVLSALPACLNPAQWAQPSGACLALQGYVGAPIALPEGMRAVFAIPLANLVRVGWYLSPLGMLLGIAGFALWWRRGMHAASWMLLTLGLLAAVFYVRQSYGTSDQHYIYILRRYMHVVYPVLCLGIAYALAVLWGVQTGRLRLLMIARRVVAAGCAAALLLFLVVTNLPIYRHVEYAGALTQLAALAQRFGPNDILLFRAGGRDTPDLVTTPLTYAFGLNALTIKSPQPGRYIDPLARYVARWQAQGRTVYLVLGPGGGIQFPGQYAERVGDLTLRLPEFEQLLDQKPRNVYDLTLAFTIYRLTPAPQPFAPASTIPVDEYLTQVGGLYRPEPFGDRQLAWTNGSALVRVPWDGRNPMTLTVDLAGGTRPATLGAARACLEARPETRLWPEDPDAPAFTPLGCFRLQEGMAGYPVRIDPARIAPPPTSTILVRIVSDAWTPAEVDPAQIDRRILGVLYGGMTRGN